MKSEQVVITNKLGLHARAAAKLVQLSNQFDS
ncbi:MAG: HPr family phosphocarrier protein, partial [Deltaproteobacteria bacterium]|nr:HPr family phosphocarrier protein [Deltaproteobacteria bacterium]